MVVESTTKATVSPISLPTPPLQSLQQLNAAESVVVTPATTLMLAESTTNVAEASLSTLAAKTNKNPIQSMYIVQNTVLA